jgi:hypothetical protein
MSPQTDWETTLREWSKPVDDDQEALAKATAEQVRIALSKYEFVPNSMMRVRAQGSKLNNTDTSDESDVDIRVEFHPDQSQADEIPTIFLSRRSAVAKSLVTEDFGLTPYTMPLNQFTFKDHIHVALEEQFGKAYVHRHDKCIKVDESSLILKADIVPCFPVRTYKAYGVFDAGVSIRCDSLEEILNYPEQHYANGVAKNEDTGRRFKKMVRCFKRMENHVVNTRLGIEPLPSFFMESLIYNCPDFLFRDESYLVSFRKVMLHLVGALDDTATSGAMMEVNGVKTLFKDGQTWTPEEALNMAAMAWYEVKP